MSLRFWPATSGEVRRYAEIETSEMRDTSLRAGRVAEVSTDRPSQST